MIIMSNPAFCSARQTAGGASARWHPIVMIILRVMINKRNTNNTYNNQYNNTQY